MDKYTQTENQRWEALRERIKELAIEPKLNYNTNQGDFKMNLQKHNQHVIDFMNSDRFDVEAYVDKFITDYNRACYESGNVDKQV